MTETTAKVYRAIKGLTEFLKRAPLQVEVAEAVAMKPQKVNYCVGQLVKLGLLTPQKKSARGLVLASKCAACGAPIRLRRPRSSRPTV